MYENPFFQSVRLVVDQLSNVSGAIMFFGSVTSILGFALTIFAALDGEVNLGTYVNSIVWIVGFAYCFGLLQKGSSSLAFEVILSSIYTYCISALTIVCLIVTINVSMTHFPEVTSGSPTEILERLFTSALFLSVLMYWASMLSYIYFLKKCNQLALKYSKGITFLVSALLIAFWIWRAVGISEVRSADVPLQSIISVVFAIIVSLSYGYLPYYILDRARERNTDLMRLDWDMFDT